MGLYKIVIIDLDQKIYIDKQERLLILFLYLTKLIYTNTKKTLTQNNQFGAQSHLP